MCGQPLVLSEIARTERTVFSLQSMPLFVPQMKLVNDRDGQKRILREVDTVVLATAESAHSSRPTFLCICGCA